MIKRLKNITNRIYSDYIMKNRFEEYENMLKSFLDKGFIFLPICEAKSSNSNDKFIIIRHDVDSESKVARKMFEIEKKFGVKSTYYFRLCTIDVDLIKEMIDYGIEVGYHYEEISTYIKERHIKNLDLIKKEISDIKSKFKANVDYFEKTINHKIYSVASHGDWINRKMKVVNKELVTEEVMEALGINVEAYDIESNLDFRLADRQYPMFWSPMSPEEIFNSDDLKKGLILVHPRQWCSAPIERFRLDFQRIIEGLRYKSII